VGLRADLDRCRKTSPSPGFDPLTVQPEASSYTDYAILANRYKMKKSINVGFVTSDYESSSYINETVYPQY
jgi:hypothetical protein